MSAHSIEARFGQAAGVAPAPRIAAPSALGAAPAMPQAVPASAVHAPPHTVLPPPVHAPQPVLPSPVHAPQPVLPSPVHAPQPVLPSPVHAPQPWDALDALDEGLAVHDRPGRQLFANAAMQRLAEEDDGLSRTRCGAVLPTDPMALRLLQRALAAAASGTAVEVAVPRASGAAPYLLRCAPVPGGSGWAVVRVADPSARRKAPSAAFLRAAFGLTQAEAALAIALCGGDCLADFATARGISIHTARTQLRALLAKTRTDRQAELVGLLTALST